MVTFLAYFDVLGDVFRCGGQPVEEGWVAISQRAWVDGVCSGLADVGVVFSGILPVVSTSSGCKQCTCEARPVVGVQGGGVTNWVVAPFEGPNHRVHRIIEGFCGDVCFHSFPVKG